MIKTGKIDLDPRVSQDESELRCPRCGSINLHHTGVTIFDREEDDDPLVRIKAVGRSVTTEIVPATDASNPSTRRHGLAIQFKCENCNWKDEPDVIELTVAQHKGSTNLGWRFDPLVAKNSK